MAEDFYVAKAAFDAAREQMAAAALAELWRLVGSQHKSITLSGEFSELSEVVLAVTEVDGEPVDGITGSEEVLSYLAATTGDEYMGTHQLANRDCVICQGEGFLLGQSYGFAVIPDGWTPVQACDEFSLFADDEDAARAAALSKGVAFAFWPASDDEPGDWAIFWANTKER